jgi:hypothetical protein
VQIPLGPSGKPTVSPTMLRRYGAAGFRLDSEEEAQGCPRQYNLWYIEKAPRGEKAPELLYGLLVHRALHLMERDGLGPDEALAKAWSESSDYLALTEQHYAEALRDLVDYMSRASSPIDRFPVLANEIRLDAELYVDEEFGPVHMQGILDRLGLDYDDPSLIHASDFKTNRFPPSIEDVMKDSQGKTYAWLVKQNLAKLLPDDVLARIDTPRVIFHLDAIKWGELPGVHFSDADLEVWQAYVTAIVRAILRDEEAKPKLNPGCARCPFKVGCPEWEALPNGAEDLLKVRPTEREALVAWLKRVSAIRLLLQKAEAEVNGNFAGDALANGTVRTSLFTWTPAVRMVAQLAAKRLHELLGEEFYDAVTVSQKRLEEIARGRDPSTAAEILECLQKVPSGTKVRKDPVRKAQV